MPGWEPWPGVNPRTYLAPWFPRTASSSKFQESGPPRRKEEEPSSPTLTHRPQPHSFTLELLLALPSWPGLWRMPSTVSTKEVPTALPYTPSLATLALPSCCPISCDCPLLSAPPQTTSIACPPFPTGHKIVLLFLFFGVVLAIYLSPLCISSPCIMESRHLLPKPELMGHRGAPMVSVGQNAGKAGRVCSSQACGFPVPHPSQSPPQPFPSPAGPREHPDVPEEDS